MTAGEGCKRGSAARMSFEEHREARSAGLRARLRLAWRVLFGGSSQGAATQDALVKLVLDNVDAAITV
jgi:hypothetical protein